MNVPTPDRFEDRWISSINLRLSHISFQKSKSQLMISSRTTARTYELKGVIHWAELFRKFNEFVSTRRFVVGIFMYIPPANFNPFGSPSWMIEIKKFRPTQLIHVGGMVGALTCRDDWNLKAPFKIFPQMACAAPNQVPTTDLVSGANSNE